MIKGVILVNNHGKPRLVKFYDRIPFEEQTQIVQEVYRAVSKRPDTVCNFLEFDRWPGRDTRLIYRHYATLYFVFVVDSSESELGILDLVQVFVEALDRCFENVCELDLIFYSDRVYYVLDEIVLGGMVLETSKEEILKSVEGLQKYTGTPSTVRKG
eukprot:TRINITY_DN36904_c0_g1_i1.p1 TRINITY_DN36904_c0_g1~~TRINITY_DN36904_c0_g1_i1.p1  ORF type:complete len:157 (+),score=26.10 TRINITY_DN36904_c0_g1_i1:165-635(+)